MNYSQSASAGRADLPFLCTWTACLNDWAELHKLNQTLLAQAVEAGASRYQIYRNCNDAAQALVVAEVANYEDAQEIGKMLNENTQAVLVSGSSEEERIWEPTGWEGIEDTTLNLTGSSRHRTGEHFNGLHSIATHTRRFHMSTQQNKAIARRVPEDIFSQGNLAVADEIVAPNLVDTSAPSGTPPGPEGVKQFEAMFRAAFPDVHYTVEEEIAEGDKVWHRVTGRATMKGEYLGMPPTGKQATWTEIHIVRIADGKLVEHVGVFDELGMMRQLGLLPEPV